MFFHSIDELENIPANTVAFEIGYNNREYSDQAFNEYGIHLPDKLEHAVTKRKAEYLAGRYAAKLCLEKYQISAFTIGSGENREPLWPIGIAGSISHTATHACAVLSKKKYFYSVGIDIERWIKPETGDNIRSLVLTDAERSVNTQASLSDNEFLTLAFSAKESLFKAVFPLYKIYFDFLDCQIIALDGARQIIHIQLERFGDEKIFSLHYVKTPYGVRTALYLAE